MKINKCYLCDETEPHTHNKQAEWVREEVQKFDLRIAALDGRVCELEKELGGEYKSGKTRMERRLGTPDRRTHGSREFRKTQWLSHSLGTACTCRRGSYDYQNGDNSVT
jgi:hypothetical protein